MSKEVLLASLKEIKGQIPADLIEEAEKNKEEKLAKLQELIEENEQKLARMSNLEGEYEVNMPKDLLDMRNLIQDAQAEIQIAYMTKQNLQEEIRSTESESETLKAQIKYYERLVERTTDIAQRAKYDSKLAEFKEDLESNKEWIKNRNKDIENTDLVLGTNTEIIEDNLEEFYKLRDKYYDEADAKNKEEKESVTKLINSLKNRAGFLNTGVFAALDEMISAIESDNMTEEEANNMLHDIKNYLGNDTDVLYAEYYNHQDLENELAIVEEQSEILSDKLADPNNYILPEEEYINSHKDLSRRINNENRLLREQERKIDSNSKQIAANNELIADNYAQREELIRNRNKAGVYDAHTLQVMARAIEENEEAIRNARHQNEELEKRNTYISNNMSNRSNNISKYNRELETLEKYHGIANEEKIEDDKAILSNLNTVKGILTRLGEATKRPLVENIDRLLERLGSNRDELKRENGPVLTNKPVEKIEDEEILDEVEDALGDLNITPTALNASNTSEDADDELSEDELIDDYVKSINDKVAAEKGELDSQADIVAPVLEDDDLPLDENDDLGIDSIVAPVINTTDEAVIDDNPEKLDDEADIVAPILEDDDLPLGDKEADIVAPILEDNDLPLDEEEAKDDKDDKDLLVAPIINNDSNVEDADKGSEIVSVEDANNELLKKIKKTILGATLWLTLVAMGTTIGQTKYVNGKLNDLQNSINTKLEQVEGNLHKDHEKLSDEHEDLSKEHADLAKDHDKILDAVEECCDCNEPEKTPKPTKKPTPKPTATPTPTPKPTPIPTYEPIPTYNPVPTSDPVPEPTCPVITPEPVPTPDPTPDPSDPPIIVDPTPAPMPTPDPEPVPTSEPIEPDPTPAPLPEPDPTSEPDVVVPQKNEVHPDDAYDRPLSPFRIPGPEQNNEEPLPQEQSIEQPVEQPVEQSVEQPVEQPVEQTVEQPIEQSAPVEQPQLSQAESNNLENSSSSFSWEAIFNGEPEDNSLKKTM